MSWRDLAIPVDDAPQTKPRWQSIAIPLDEPEPVAAPRAEAPDRSAPNVAQLRSRMQADARDVALFGKDPQHNKIMAEAASLSEPLQLELIDARTKAMDDYTRAASLADGSKPLTKTEKMAARGGRLDERTKEIRDEVQLVTKTRREMSADRRRQLEEAQTRGELELRPLPGKREPIQEEEIQRELRRREQEAVRLQGRYLREVPGYANPVVRGVKQGLAEAGMSVPAMAQRAVGGDADATFRHMETMRAAAGDLDEQELSPILSRGLRGAISSAPEIIVGAVTKSPTAAIGLGATRTANESYSEAGRQGLRGGKRASYAATQGAIEGGTAALFQRLGLGGVESIGRDIARRGAMAVLKRLPKTLAAEITEETATTIQQQIATAKFGVDPAMSPEAMSQAIADTVVQTILTVGLAQTQAVPGAVDAFMKNRSRKNAAAIGLPPMNMKDRQQVADELAKAEGERRQKQQQDWEAERTAIQRDSVQLEDDFASGKTSPEQATIIRRQLRQRSDALARGFINVETPAANAAAVGVPVPSAATPPQDAGPSQSSAPSVGASPPVAEPTLPTATNPSAEIQPPSTPATQSTSPSPTDGASLQQPTAPAAEAQAPVDSAVQNIPQSIPPGIPDPNAALKRYEFERGYSAIIGVKGRKGYRTRENQDLINRRDSDVQWEQLKKQAQNFQSSAARKDTLQSNAGARQTALQEAANGEITKNVTKYAPLHVLPRDLAQTIQAEAQRLLATSKSDKTKSALAKIIKDAGSDTGAAVEQQKERIVGILSGSIDQRSLPEKQYGEPARPVDPVVSLFLAEPEQRGQLIDAAIASIDGGQANDLALYADERLAESSGVPFSTPGEVIDYLNALRVSAKASAAAVVPARPESDLPAQAAGEDAGFELQRQPAAGTPKPAEFDPLDRTRQKALLSGLDALPGQQDLFDDVDQAEDAGPATTPPKVAPIVQFRKDAVAIEARLPPVPEGYTRLWRGNRPNEVGIARAFTNDLPGIALPFRKGYGGEVSYVDVPSTDLPKYENTAGTAPGAEFGLPPELAKNAKVATRNAGKPIAGDFKGQFDAAFDDAVATLGEGSPLVPIADLRNRLPQFSRQQFDAELRKLRLADQYHADTSDGSVAQLTDEQRAAGIKEGRDNMVYVSRSYQPPAEKDGNGTERDAAPPAAEPTDATWSWKSPRTGKRWKSARTIEAEIDKLMKRLDRPRADIRMRGEIEAKVKAYWLDWHDFKAQDAKERKAAGLPPAMARDDLPYVAVPHKGGQAFANLSPGGPQIPVTMAIKQGPAVSARGIVAEISRLFDLPIRMGKVAGGRRRLKGALGIYKLHGQIARLDGTAAADIAVAAHETAHHIDNLHDVRNGIPMIMQSELANLDYDPKTRREVEGFAEFIRLYLTHDLPDVRRKAPNFFDHFTQVWLPAHADVAKPLQQIKQKIATWQDAGPLARFAGSISKTGKPDPTESLIERARRKLLAAERLAVDDKAAIADYVDAAAREESLEPGEDPYKYAQVFTHTASAQARDAIDNGVFSLITGERIGPSLTDAFEQLGPEVDIDEFSQFLKARHELDVQATGRATSASERDTEAVYQQFKGRPGWLAAADTVTEFHKALVKMTAEAGRLAPEAAQKILKSLPHYVPLRRVVDERAKQASNSSGTFDPRNPVKRMSKSGSGLPVKDVLAVTLQIAEDFYGAAHQQIVAQKIIDLQKNRDTLGGYVTEIPADSQVIKVYVAEIRKEMEKAGADLTDVDDATFVMLHRRQAGHRGDKPYVVSYETGKPKWFELHPDLYRDTKTLDPVKLPLGLEGTLAGRAITGATQVKRLGATGLRPSFGTYFNPVRDFFTHAIRTDGNSATAPIRMLGTAIHQMTDAIAQMSKSGHRDPVFSLYEQYGGEMAGLIGQDLKKAYASTHEVYRAAHGKHAKNRALHPLRTLQTIFGFFEQTPRMAEFEMILKRHGYSREDMNAGKVPPPAVVVEAMYAAMNVTTNFKRAGTVGRVVNKISAYSNAKVQDIATDYQVLKQYPQRTFVRGFMWLTVPSILYWLTVKDEDWYEELPAWRRYGGWNFRAFEKTITVPSPFMLGHVFAHLPIAVLDSLYRQDKKRVGQWAERLKAEYVPDTASVLPDVIEPAVEVMYGDGGWDFFRQREIVGEDIQKLKPKDQSYEFNSSAAKYFGHLFGASPAKIDHLIHGYTGGLGTDLLKIPDEGLLRSMGYSRISRPTDRGESIDEFYAEKDSTEQELGSAKLNGKPPRDLADKLAKMEVASKFMSEIRDAANEIKDQDERSKYQRWVTGLARAATGKDDLPMYPNPFTDAKLPDDLVEARDKVIKTAATQLSDERPKLKDYKGRTSKWREAIENWETEKTRAAEFFKSFGVERSVARGVLSKHLKSEVKTPELRDQRMKRFSSQF